MTIFTRTSVFALAALCLHSGFAMAQMPGSLDGGSWHTPRTISPAQPYSRTLNPFASPQPVRTYRCGLDQQILRDRQQQLGPYRPKPAQIGGFQPGMVAPTQTMPNRFQTMPGQFPLIGGAVQGGVQAGVQGNVGLDPRTGKLTGELSAGVEGMLQGSAGGIGQAIGGAIGGGRSVGIRF